MTVARIINPRELLAAYEAAPPKMRDAIQKAMDAAIQTIREAGYEAPMDDRCAVAEAALFWFVQQANRE